MKIAFSTLACFDWKLPDIIAIASQCGYDGVELRFVENEDALYKLPAFRGSGLASSKRMIADAGLAICCVDTSCRFHFPEFIQRVRWVEEGIRMAALAAELGSPAVRVFGDQIQPGANRESTRQWIADCIRELSLRIRPMGVDVWLETHGDFASVAESMEILTEAQAESTALIWDPANCMAQTGERPVPALSKTPTRIKHVHIKDHKQQQEGWTPVLMGEGTFPLHELQLALRSIHFEGFISYEWERKWHPKIPDAKIALPHFAQWFRNTWQ